jgi:phosphinothricin acetyltransferase
MHIRNAAPSDVQALVALRNYYIANTIVVFDEQPLTAAAVEDWVGKFSASGPYQLLVAEDGKQMLGFCGSQQFRAHPSFGRTVEFSICCDANARGKGVGTALYKALLERLAGQEPHRAVVGIALPNEASVALHEKFGFTRVGVFSEYAVKNGRFISSQWMERALP